MYIPHLLFFYKRSLVVRSRSKVSWVIIIGGIVHRIYHRFSHFPNSFLCVLPFLSSLWEWLDKFQFCFSPYQAYYCPYGSGYEFGCAPQPYIYPQQSFSGAIQHTLPQTHLSSAVTTYLPISALPTAQNMATHNNHGSAAPNGYVSESQNGAERQNLCNQCESQGHLTEPEGANKMAMLNNRDTNQRRSSFGATANRMPKKSNLSRKCHSSVSCSNTPLVSSMDEFTTSGAESSRDLQCSSNGHVRKNRRRSVSS